MTLTFFLRPLISGILHSFEPDHITAVSILATENAKKKINYITIIKASQWAYGHSLTLLLFGGISLLFKTLSSIVIDDISYYAELAVGPIMIWLGIRALKRTYSLNLKINNQQKSKPQRLIHTHNNKVNKKSINLINKTFWIGMLHGLAGTGGALTSALVLSCKTIADAIIVLMIESLGIIIAMGIYSYILIYAMSRILEHNFSILKGINFIIGLASIIIGFIWCFKTIS